MAERIFTRSELEYIDNMNQGELEHVADFLDRFRPIELFPMYLKIAGLMINKKASETIDEKKSKEKGVFDEKID